MNNSQTQATLNTRHRTKTNQTKNTTQKTKTMKTHTPPRGGGGGPDARKGYAIPV